MTNMQRNSSMAKWASVILFACAIGVALLVWMRPRPAVQPISRPRASTGDTLAAKLAQTGTAASSAPSSLSARANSPTAHSPANSNPPSGPKPSATPISTESRSTTETANSAPTIPFLLTGRVTLSNGRPASTTLVQLLLIDPMKMSRNLSLPGPTARTETSPAGEYRLEFRVGSDATCLLTASHPSAPRVAVSLNLESSIEEMKNASASKPPLVHKIQRDIVLPLGASVRGIVVNEQDQPVEKAKILIMAMRDPAGSPRQSFFIMEDRQTAANGLFDLMGTAQPSHLVVTHSQYITRTIPVTPPADNLRIQLSATGASIEGRVFNKSTGAAVEGAEIRIHPDTRPSSASLSIISDSTGAFLIEKLSEGEYGLSARKEGLSPAALSNSFPFVRVNVSRKERKSGVELFLFTGYKLTGMVKEKGTGKPIEGVELSLMGQYAIRSGKAEPELVLKSVSGADGRYELDGITVFSMRIQLKKRGYLPAENMMYSGDMANSIWVNLTPGQDEQSRDFEMRIAPCLSGRVRDPAGNAVPSATLDVIMRSGEGSRNKIPAASDGSFAIEVPDHSTVRLRANAEGYPSAQSEMMEVADRNIDGIEIILTNGRRVSGKVLRPNGQASSNATVEMMEWTQFQGSASGQTIAKMQVGADGSFAFEKAPNGKISVKALEKGYAASPSFTIPPVLEGANPAPLDTVTLQLRVAHRLAGRVVNRKGEPIEKVHISAQGGNGDQHLYVTTESDSEGRFALEGLADFPVSIDASAPMGSYKYYSKSDVAVDQESCQIVLTKNEEEESDQGSVQLLGKALAWNTRQPIEKFEIEGYQAEKVADEPGYFVVKQLKRGHSYALTIRAEGYLPNSTSFVVPSASAAASSPESPEIIEKEFLIGPGGTVSGRLIQSGTKEPVADKEVQLLGNPDRLNMIPPPPPQAFQRTASDGRFRFENVPLGRNMAAIRDEKTGNILTRNLNITEHGQNVDLGDLEWGSGAPLEFRVVRLPANTPLAGVSIQLRNSGMDVPRMEITRQTDGDGVCKFEAVSPGDYFGSISSLPISYSLKITKESASFIIPIGDSHFRGRMLCRNQPYPGAVTLYLLKASLPTGDAGEKTGALQTSSSQANSDGSFDIGSLAPGQWKVSATIGRNRHFTGIETDRVIEVPPAGDVTSDVILPGGRIRGRVALPPNRASSDASTIAVTCSPNHRSDYISDNGSFELECLPPGTYSLTVTGQDITGFRTEGVVVPENGDSAFVTLKAMPQAN